MKYSKRGQALIEYLIVLGLVLVIGSRILSAFTSYLGDTIGQFNVVLSRHLTVGVCARDCFAQPYANGPTVGGQ